MATNTLALSNIAVKKGITQFKYALSLCGQLDNRSEDFTGFFGSAGKARAGGVTRDIVKPARPISVGSFGSTDGTFSASNFIEETTPMTLNGYFKNHVELTTLKDTTDVTDKGMQFSDQSILSLGNKIEGAVASYMAPKVPFGVLAGTGGATIGDAGLVLTSLAENGAPDGMFNFTMGQRLHSAVVGNTTSFYNPEKAISKQYYAGYMGEAQGASWFRNEHIPIQVNGTANAGVFGADYEGYTKLGDLAGATANGATSIVLDGITTDGTIKAGQIIMIPTVMNINQWNRNANAGYRTFAVASDVTSSVGGATITLTEKIVDGSGTTFDASLQNVSALPADNDVCYILGEAGASYLQGIGFYKDACAFASIPLIKPNGKTEYTYMKRDGLNLRYIEMYDKDDLNISRLDFFGGVQMLRPEFSARLWQKIG